MSLNDKPSRNLLNQVNLSAFSRLIFLFRRFRVAQPVVHWLPTRKSNLANQVRILPKTAYALLELIPLRKVLPLSCDDN